MNEPLLHRYLSLGVQAMERGAFGQAEASFRDATRLDPTSSDARFHLALALSAQSKSDACLDELLAALELNPRLGPAYLLLSSLYQRQGRFDKAIEAAKAAIELNPRLSKPYVDIVHSKRVDASDAYLIERLERMADEPDRSPGEQIGLNYGLGKAYNDLRQFERAMERYAQANRIAWKLVGSQLGYRPADESRAIDQVIRSFDAEFFTRACGLGSTSELPVLIVGMIRSGTTLLDTSLSRHPEIATAGELEFWEAESLPLLRDAYRGVIDASRLEEVSSRYRRLLRAVAIKRKRAIDKMPVNYLHIGLIHAALPNARFIHTRRDPVDTCLSIYMTEFGLEPPKFAFSRPNIVHAYREYLRLMDHWRRVIPADRMFEIEYEDLVLRREETLRQIIQFLGLDWDDSILELEPHQGRSRGEIVTPSRWQARQPVYQTSLERWRNYEPWLGEFAELRGARR